MYLDYETETSLDKYKRDILIQLKNDDDFKIIKGIQGGAKKQITLSDYLNINTIPKSSAENGYVYIASSYEYMKRNKYKVGYTTNLISRLSSLNNNKIQKDRCFYQIIITNTIDIDSNKKKNNTLEKIIHKELDFCRESKTNEFFDMKYSVLKDLVFLLTIKYTKDCTHEIVLNIDNFIENIKYRIPMTYTVETNDELNNDIDNIIDMCKNEDININAFKEAQAGYIKEYLITEIGYIFKPGDIKNKHIKRISKFATKNKESLDKKAIQLLLKEFGFYKNKEINLNITESEEKKLTLCSTNSNRQ